MKLIKKLGTRLSKNGKYSVTYGIFWCNYCKSEVKRDLSNGLKQVSCGCLNLNIKHSGFGTRLYKIWEGMKARCLNPNRDVFYNYGGRGITICPEWIDKENGFINFRNWSLSNGYTENLTIDRKDNDLDYSPENCRWVTKTEQQRNKRNNIINKQIANKIKEMYKIGNYTQKELAIKFNTDPSHISRIINNKRWGNTI